MDRAEDWESLMLLKRSSRLWVVLLSCGVVAATVGLASNVPTTHPAGAAPLPARPLRSTSAHPEAGTVTPAEPAPDEKEILIVQALEQPTSLNIQDVPIVDAVRLLSEKTGVPIDFDRFTLGCLPYGSKTLVTARIQRQPLRESLIALLRPLACKFVQEGDRLVIQPRPAMFRICRRATWEEVSLIQKLYSTPWSKALADSLQFQFQDMSEADTLASRKKLYELADSVGAGHSARVLEYASQQYGWEWHPEGPNTVSFCTRTRQIELQLSRSVSAQYSEAQLKDVLLDLAGWAGVLLKLEPGVLASLPTQQAERFHLTLENVTIRQALELIMGQTGLGYFIEPDGVRITASSFGGGASSSPSAEPTVRVNPIVGQITIPGANGTSYGFYIREQDLSPDINELRLLKVKQCVPQLRAVLMSQPAK